jgi:hypothetical protein
MARLQAQALINSITAGGTPPPDWMSDGFTNLARLYMAHALTNPKTPAASFLYVLGNGTGWHSRGSRLPRQVDEPGAPAWWRSDTEYFRSAAEIVLIDKPQSQPTTLALQALYKRVGKGGVAEIMQRLGAGESVDEAFEAVTGMTETECLKALSKAA